jgi:hypothetical protein
MNAYIEIVSEHTMMRFDLDEFDLWAIGGSYVSARSEFARKNLSRREFTRENIAAWLDRGNCRFEIGIYGWKDFHAVCGDIDIPWGLKPANRSRAGMESERLGRPSEKYYE